MRMMNTFHLSVSFTLKCCAKCSDGFAEFGRRYRNIPESPCVETTPLTHAGVSNSLENTVVPHDRLLTLTKDKDLSRHAWKVP